MDMEKRERLQTHFQYWSFDVRKSQANHMYFELFRAASVWFTNPSIVYSIHSYIIYTLPCQSPRTCIYWFPNNNNHFTRALVGNSKWKWKCVCSRLCHSKGIAKIIYFKWEENHFYWENLIVISLLVIDDSFHFVRFSHCFEWKNRNVFDDRWI